MTTEKNKMLRGEYYFASDPELAAERLRAKELCKQFNDCMPNASELRFSLLQELLGSLHEDVVIESPFHCDYGYNIHLGQRVYMNFGCILLDPAPITMGNDVMLGPNVQLYTATHPLDWQIRKYGGEEFCKPITIGDDTWIGGSAVICPGVKIGQRCVIGAASVVTKDIPDNSLAMGNPARVVRQLILT